MNSRLSAWDASGQDVSFNRLNAARNPKRNKCSATLQILKRGKINFWFRKVGETIAKNWGASRKISQLINKEVKTR